MGDPEALRDVDRRDAREQHAEDGVLGRVEALVKHRPDARRHGGQQPGPEPTRRSTTDNSASQSYLLTSASASAATQQAASTPSG